MFYLFEDHFVFKDEKDGKNIDVYVKIDNSIGLENIDNILPNANGVFLHRPKLSMEIGHDRIFRAQKIVLSKCNIVSLVANDFTKVKRFAFISTRHV